MPIFYRCLFVFSIINALLTSVDGFGVVSLDTFHVINTAASTVHHQAPAAALLDAYKNQLQMHPLSTKMITGGALAVCGDAIAQATAINGGEANSYDKKRASSFAVFDAAYRALQHFSFPLIVQNCHGQIATALLNSLLPATMAASIVDPNLAAAMERCLASQLVIVPFLYYPAFFSLTGAMQGLSVQESIERAQEKFLPLMQRNLLFWIPVQFIQFGFIQEDLQIPFLSVCGLAWTFILSIMAGAAQKSNFEVPASEEEQPAIIAAEEQQLIRVIQEDQTHLLQVLKTIPTATGTETMEDNNAAVDVKNPVTTI